MMPDFHQEGQPQVKEWAPEQEAPVILIENVSKTYGKIHALSGITLALSGGVTGILGMNGAGKSTLFKILMGKLKPSSGQVRLFGTIHGRIQHHILVLVLFLKVRRCMIG